VAGQDIIVMGASAGGVEALSRLVAGLPPDLQAAVFIVLHVPPTPSSALPNILGRHSPLPVAHAIDGEPVRRGRVYVAPADRHLLLQPGRVRVTAGPKENGYRPAVDSLFRTAAAAYGRRVAGVILSGSLDDGTAGLRAVKSRGGVAIVQDPDEALYQDMPLHALAGDPPDHVLGVAAIGRLLAELAGGGPAEKAVQAPHRSEDGDLWTAYRALKERAALCRRLATRAAERGHGHSARHFELEAGDAERRALLVQGVLGTGDPADPRAGDDTDRTSSRSGGRGRSS